MCRNSFNSWNLTNKWLKVFENLAFPILLVVVAFWNFNKGIDLTDAGYNIDYFLHFKEYVGSEVIPTFWSSFLGYLFTLLPFGQSWVGISFYCTLVIAAMAVLAYFFCKRYMDYRMVFVTEILAVMYCWNPSAVLYDYLSFLLLEAGVILLMRGIEKDSWGLMFSAGIVLGVNVFVRIPNLTHCAAIVLLWMSAVWNRRKFRWAVHRTLVCVAGYLTGFIFSVVVILLRYDFQELKLAIYVLKETSTSQTNYGIWYMATETLRDVFAGWTNISWADSSTSVAAMVGITALLLLVGILLSVTGLLLEKETDYRLLCLVFLGVFYVTPLGSNNHIYLSMLNMFLLLPIMGMLMMRGIRRIGKHMKYAAYPLTAVACILALLCGGEIVLFGVNFNWKDSPEVKVTEDGSFIDGMWTSEARRDEILALEEYFSDNDLKGSYGILYCNAPALEAVLDLVPVMSSPWADWYTYSVDSFYEGIVKARLLSGSGEAPLIIVNRAYYEVLEGIRPEVTTGEVCIDDKYFLLIRYIWDFDYEPVFMTAEFVVYKEGE